MFRQNLVRNIRLLPSGTIFRPPFLRPLTCKEPGLDIVNHRPQIRNGIDNVVSATCAQHACGALADAGEFIRGKRRNLLLRLPASLPLSATPTVPQPAATPSLMPTSASAGPRAGCQRRRDCRLHILAPSPAAGHNANSQNSGCKIAAVEMFSSLTPT
jgi:hypothetical protein